MKRAIATTVIGITALALAGCTAGPSEGSSDEDLTMWVRSGTAAQSQAMVDAWNASHKRQIDLTVIPNENYLQKVGVAAGAGDLPDLLTSDGVFAPNYTSQGLFADITDKVAALDYKDDLVQAQLDVGTRDGNQYTVPHTVAVSALFQNNVLLREAGIDPEAPVETLDQLAENARKVAALGDGRTGIYLTGNNGGSIGFTVFPSIWASGAEVLNEDGTEILSDSPEFAGVFQVFNDLFQEGVISPTAREEIGTTRDEVFAGGKVGYLLGSNSVLTNVPDTDAVEVGAQPMPGLEGGVSTYVGGDVIGIASTSEHQDAAWEFLEWTLSDETQVDVIAKGGFLVSRSDLADNEYSAADPRIVTLNSLVSEGRIPFAMNYGQTFSDANGPWLTAARGALFDPKGAAAALAESRSAIDSALAG